MPKLIENVRENLIREARHQAETIGYSSMTIRSISEACGIGTGTVYNYFPSKEHLAAAFMLEDWEKLLCGMKKLPCRDPETFLESVFGLLRGFFISHAFLFRDRKAEAAYTGSVTGKHPLLRNQLAGVILPVCAYSAAEDKPFLSEFIAESFLSWAGCGENFTRLYSVIRFIFENK
ncbi:MAG: TetR/AcrR family transcriptional regulator [Clostridia bacterium]|nr:TetR/AcrR family transcriptional regulator [Clostridia bacterium]